MFLKTSQYSQENTSVCEILKNNIFDETPLVTASTITVSFGEEVVNSWIKHVGLKFTKKFCFTVNFLLELILFAMCETETTNDHWVHALDIYTF